jgi:hypothetical protein
MPKALAQAIEIRFRARHEGNDGNDASGVKSGMR